VSSRAVCVLGGSSSKVCCRWFCSGAVWRDLAAALVHEHTRLQLILLVFRYICSRCVTALQSVAVWLLETCASVRGVVQSGRSVVSAARATARLHASFVTGCARWAGGQAGLRGAASRIWSRLGGESHLRVRGLLTMIQQLAVHACGQLPDAACLPQELPRVFCRTRALCSGECVGVEQQGAGAPACWWCQDCFPSGMCVCV
jgi:hypothetical protein